jgi:hypothetical protein
MSRCARSGAKPHTRKIIVLDGVPIRLRVFFTSGRKTRMGARADRGRRRLQDPDATPRHVSGDVDRGRSKKVRRPAVVFQRNVFTGDKENGFLICPREDSQHPGGRVLPAIYPDRDSLDTLGGCCLAACVPRYLSPFRRSVTSHRSRRRHDRAPASSIYGGRYHVADNGGYYDASGSVDAADC